MIIQKGQISDGLVSLAPPMTSLVRFVLPRRWPTPATLPVPRPTPLQTSPRLVRGHWGIENRVHWVLDVTFHEDASHIRTGDAPQNMGVLRHIALNLLRQEPRKGSLKTKRFRATLDQTYLATVLGL